MGLAALLAACASPPPAPAARPTNDQLAQVRAVEQAYRENLPEYAALRDAALADPLQRAWLVRMFVRDLFAAREGRPIDSDRWRWVATAQQPEPLETRALAELRHIGAGAVPTLIEDLLYHEQPLPREMGVELLAYIGAPAVPPLQGIAREGEPRQRRAAARALGRIGADGEALAILRELCADGDYTVRADALRALEGGGVDARAVLLTALRDDDDAFVRRVAAETLATFPQRSTALALVDYLERCKRDKDSRGENTAQESLLRLAAAAAAPDPRDVKAPHPLAKRRTPEQWRAFADGLVETPPRTGAAR